MKFSTKSKSMLVHFTFLVLNIYNNVLLTLADEGTFRPYETFVTKRPKVIITALADDYGYYNVGFSHGPLKMGNPEARTPNLDDLAKNGIVLDRMYTYKYCSPTRSSFLSGRLATHVNQNNLNNDIQAKSGPDLRFTLLPEKLKSLGYTTSMVGKSHLGARSKANLPINRGFDYHFGFLKGGEDHYTQGSGSNYHEKNVVDLWENHKLSNESGVYSTYLYTKKAIERIEQFAATQQLSKKQHLSSIPITGLYLYLAWHNTHTPLECPKEYYYPSLYNNSNSSRMTYNCMSRMLDDGMGNITRSLKNNFLWNDTLIFFSADNGGWNGNSGANNYPLRGSKVSDFEGGIRAVSFLYGGINILPSYVRGTTHTGLISIADWYSTLIHLVNGSDPTDHVNNLPNLDSINIWPSLMIPNATNSGRDEIFLSWSCGDPTNSLDPTKCNPNEKSIYGTFGDPTFGQASNDKALIYKQWKIIIGNQQRRGVWTGPVYPNGTNDGIDSSCVAGCLFNIFNDPTEHVNLINKKPLIWKYMLNKLINNSHTVYQTNYGEPDLKCISGKQAAKYYRGHNTCWNNSPGYTPSGISCSNTTIRTYLGPMCFKQIPKEIITIAED
jgi:arylsulfatase B